MQLLTYMFVWRLEVKQSVLTLMPVIFRRRFTKQSKSVFVSLVSQLSGMSWLDNFRWSQMSNRACDLLDIFWIYRFDWDSPVKVQWWLMHRGTPAAPLLHVTWHSRQPDIAWHGPSWRNVCGLLSVNNLKFPPKTLSDGAQVNYEMDIDDLGRLLFCNSGFL